jgi:plasmid stability protein
MDRITIELPKDIKLALKVKAAQEDTTMTEIILSLLQSALKTSN